MHEPPVIGVCANPAKDLDLLKAAARIAVDVGLPFLEKPKKAGYEMLLTVTSEQLELHILQGDAQMKGGRPVAVDLESINVTSGPGRSLKQPLAKAVGLKSSKFPAMTVIDATAGWGEDAWVLAALGCHVLSVERNKIMATLLRDGLFRTAVKNPEMLQRISLVNADAKHLLRRIARLNHPPLEGQTAEAEERIDDLPESMKDFLEPDVVYLDPMFPQDATGPKKKKSTERKPLRVLRRLAGDDTDALELFDWALRVAKKRVVVKRPAKAPPIAAEPKPAVKFTGKGFRFDVYSIKRK